MMDEKHIACPSYIFQTQLDDIWAYFWAFYYQWPNTCSDPDYLLAVSRDILWKHTPFLALSLWLTKKSYDFLVTDFYSTASVVVFLRKVSCTKWSVHVPVDNFDDIFQCVQHVDDYMVVFWLGGCMSHHPLCIILVSSSHSYAPTTIWCFSLVEGDVGIMYEPSSRCGITYIGFKFQLIIMFY